MCSPQKTPPPETSISKHASLRNGGTNKTETKPEETRGVLSEKNEKDVKHTGDSGHSGKNNMATRGAWQPIREGRSFKR